MNHGSAASFPPPSSFFARAPTETLLGREERVTHGVNRKRRAARAGGQSLVCGGKIFSETWSPFFKRDCSAAEKRKLPSPPPPSTTADGEIFELICRTSRRSRSCPSLCLLTLNVYLGIGWIADFHPIPVSFPFLETHFPVRDSSPCASSRRGLATVGDVERRYAKRGLRFKKKKAMRFFPQPDVTCAYFFGTASMTAKKSFPWGSDVLKYMRSHEYFIRLVAGVERLKVAK